MAHMSRRFNFDDFDEQCREALDSNDEVMGNLIPLRRPGEIGAVACAPTLDPDPVPDPPEAA